VPFKLSKKGIENLNEDIGKSVPLEVLAIQVDRLD
jgi:hypothetical protein